MYPSTAFGFYPLPSRSRVKTRVAPRLAETGENISNTCRTTFEHSHEFTTPRFSITGPSHVGARLQSVDALRFGKAVPLLTALPARSGLVLQPSCQRALDSRQDLLSSTTFLKASERQRFTVSVSSLDGTTVPRIPALAVSKQASSHSVATMRAQGHPVLSRKLEPAVTQILDRYLHQEVILSLAHEFTRPTSNLPLGKLRALLHEDEGKWEEQGVLALVPTGAQTMETGVQTSNWSERSIALIDGDLSALGYEVPRDVAAQSRLVQNFLFRSIDHVIPFTGAISCLRRDVVLFLRSHHPQLRIAHTTLSFLCNKFWQSLDKESRTVYNVKKRIDAAFKTRYPWYHYQPRVGLSRKEYLEGLKAWRRVQESILSLLRRQAWEFRLDEIRPRSSRDQVGVEKMPYQREQDVELASGVPAPSLLPNLDVFSRDDVHPELITLSNDVGLILDWRPGDESKFDFSGHPDPYKRHEVIDMYEQLQKRLYGERSAEDKRDASSNVESSPATFELPLNMELLLDNSGDTRTADHVSFPLDGRPDGQAPVFIYASLPGIEGSETSRTTYCYDHEHNIPALMEYVREMANTQNVGVPLSSQYHPLVDDAILQVIQQGYSRISISREYNEGGT